MTQIIALSDKQLSAIEKLNKFKVGALFMEPGTGKTLATYELIKSVSEIKNVVWLTPCQTKENLKNEIEKCGGLDSLTIIGIETISSSDATYLNLMSIINEFTFLIVDESLKIKNWSAKRTKRIIELGKRCQYKLILNGTPATKTLLDLWAQLEFLSPKILKMDLAEFENTFCEYVKITKSFGRIKKETKHIKEYHNIDYLYSLIGHYVYNCDLDLLVQKQFNVINYTVDPEMLSEYNRLKSEYLSYEKLAFLNNNIFLEMSQKMQHSYCVTSDKFLKLDDIFKKHNQESVIVFCKYISSKTALEFRYPNTTILTYGKHSFGLNLQDKNITIYFDKTFDYAQRIQSGYRTYRIGQNKDCVFYDLTGNVGLESVIDKSINKKMSMSEYFKSKSINEIIKEL